MGGIGPGCCATTGTSRHFASIDDRLGSAERRFFGSGYRHVRHRLDDIRVSAGSEQGSATARATVEYPPDWSRKAGHTALRPHLSSVDAAVLGLELAEVYLTHAHRLDRTQRRRIWPRRVGIKAGGAPQENLIGFDVEVARTAVVPTATVCQRTSRLRARLGNMRVSCDIEHDGTAGGHPAGRYESADELLGDAERQCVGAGFRSRRHAIRDVDIDVHSGRIDATVVMERPDAARFAEGMGAAYQPATTAIDGLLVVAQLGQALLYETDRMDRDASNPLWLRNLEMETAHPRPLSSGPCRASLVIRAGRLLHLRDQPWRTADVTAWFGGIRFSGSIAHQLPAR